MFRIPVHQHEQNADSLWIHPCTLGCGFPAAYGLLSAHADDINNVRHIEISIWREPLCV
jgi:hypothetical protein